MSSLDKPDILRNESIIIRFLIVCLPLPPGLLQINEAFPWN